MDNVEQAADDFAKRTDRSFCCDCLDDNVQCFIAGAKWAQVTPEKLKEHLDKNYSSETFKRQVMRIFEELKI